MDASELLIHPVRLRIVHALSGGQAMTTIELGERMPDVSKAGLYRHVDRLAEAGVLEVAQERRARGAVERRYRLRREHAAVTADSSTTPDEWRRAFVAAMAALLSEFDAYLGREVADPIGDLVGFRQHAMWLSPDELEALIADLRAAIMPRLAQSPTPDRRQYLLSPIHFPID